MARQRRLASNQPETRESDSAERPADGDDRARTIAISQPAHEWSEGADDEQAGGVGTGERSATPAELPDQDGKENAEEISGAADAQRHRQHRRSYDVPSVEDWSAPDCGDRTHTFTMRRPEERAVRQA